MKKNKGKLKQENIDIIINSAINQVKEEVKTKPASKSLDDELKVTTPKKKQVKHVDYLAIIKSLEKAIYNSFSPTYQSSSNIDYNKLFSYLQNLTKKKDVVYEESKPILKSESSSELGEKEIMQEQQLIDFLRKTTLNFMTGTNMNDISAEEKERFNYYAMFNRPWIQAKYTLLGLGERPLHAPSYR